MKQVILTAPRASPEDVAEILGVSRSQVRRLKVQIGRRNPIAGKQKEMRFGIRISPHDYGYRVKRIEKFLREKNTVLVTVYFRGREIQHPELGEQLINKLLAELGEKARTTAKPKMQGKLLQILILPGLAQQESAPVS